MDVVRSFSPVLPDPFDLSTLEGSLDGRVIRPGSDDYDVSRQAWNAAHDRRPVAIVRVATDRDVARTVLFAREAGLDLAIRGGGHSLAGYSTSEGLILDLADMRGLHIDPEARVAWAQAGLTAGEVIDATAAHGLAIPFGDAGSVGIAGLTLGGGIGWLVRKHGLAIDSLLAVEIVTADGRILTASEDEHPDLFWAVRGGGGNFGVVTRFKFRLHPVGMVLGGALFLPPNRDVLRGLVPVAASAPEELSTITFFMPTPPLPFIPESEHGKPVIVVMMVYAGDDLEVGQAAVEPFRKLATPIADMVDPMPYPAIYQLTADGGQRHASVTRSMFASHFDDAAVDTVLESMAAAPSMPMFQLRVLGGAMAEVPADATAFAHRDAPLMISIISPIHDPAQAAEIVAYTESFHRALAPIESGVYVNFLEREGEARIAEAYPSATYARLADVKRRYDPANLFHLNQNIRPAD